MTDTRFVARSRADGELPTIQYDEKTHPGIIQRCALFGMTREKTASILGIHESTLYEWAKRHHEVADALKLADYADAEVMKSLYDQAVGWIDPETGRRRGTNVAAGIFWMKNRQKWRSEPLEPQGDGKGGANGDDPKDVTPSDDDIARLAKRVAGGETDPPEVVDAEYEEFKE